MLVEAGRVMLVGLMVQETPEGADRVKVTVPEKPFTPLRVIMEESIAPVETAGGEDAVRVKSGPEPGVIVKAIEIAWRSAPLAALTVAL